MASSLISGLINNGYSAEKITVTDPEKENLDQLQQQFSVNTSTDNNQAIHNANIVLLAVKPQILHDVCCNIKAAVEKARPLIISIAAGIRSTDIDRWLGANNAIIRCMPNTPALIQAGASGLFANPQTGQAQKDAADRILTAAGITVWVDKESQLDAVTAVSGSGPAYFFLFIEAMQLAGNKLGLDMDTAGLLARQTALGAARMAIEGNDDAATLRSKVTSKGGTTAAAIASLENNNFSAIIEEALTAANNRAVELADELGQQ